MAPERPATRADLLSTYDQIADKIMEAMPELRPQLSVGSMTAALFSCTEALIGDIDVEDAVQLARSRIVNQALNDYLDLLYEAFSGRGRPALRTARTLFEHLVNYRWIDADPVEAERYCKHGAVGDLLDLEVSASREEEFTGNARRAYRHWRQKAERQIRRDANAAIDQYGDSFRRSWASKSLRDRAARHGLADEYDTAYRLLSAVIHGNAAGDVGHRASIGGHSVVRTGPALAVCPLALRCGHRYFTLLVTEWENAAGRPEPMARLRELVRVVAERLDDHRTACLALDDGLWPATESSGETRGSDLVIEVTPSGLRLRTQG